MGRTRDVSKILTSNTSILTLASASATYATKASTGSTLINTTSFSAQSTVSIDNVFSATYDTYKIIFTGNSSNTDVAGLNLRVRVGGSDNSSSNYRFSKMGLYDNSPSPTLLNAGTNGLTTWFNNIGLISSTAGYTGQTLIEISNPFAAKNTSVFSQTITHDQSGRGELGVYAGTMSVTTSYTGFSFITSSGNMTGSVSVYGYNK